MAKTSKKALGAAMAGVMAVGAVAGAVNAVDQVKVANAATESQALKNAKAKISHLSWSVKNNYLGIKNQATWEQYIKESRGFIAQMPASEALQAQGLTSDVDKIAALVQAVARVNQVEKSMETNFKGIKNAKTWRGYLELAKIDIVKVDPVKFADEIAKITERLNKSSDEVKKIEDAFKVDYDKVVASFNDVKKTKDLDQAKKVLKDAEALGTCEESDKLEADIKAFISEIDKSAYSMVSVDSINSKKIEIKFNKEVEDAKAIAKDGDRIVIVKSGNSINDKDSESDKRVSNIITFTSDNKTATAVFDKEFETGVKYTVHLVSTDGKSSLASATTVLVGGGSSSPDVSVSDGSDKIIVKFSEKMNDKAIDDWRDYKVIKSNKEEIRGSEAFTKAEWVDKVDKREVKFTVAPGKLLAGEEYKLEVPKTVETDKGKDLSSSDRVLKFSTPSISSSRPQVQTAYVENGSKLIVKFDKKITDKVSKDLINLKRNDGKTLSINSARQLSDDAKAIEIEVPNNTFEDGENYRLSLESNAVINNVYRNAGNASVSSHSVSVPDAKAVTSLKAKFVQQSDKTKYDLLLEFDRPVKGMDTSDLKIKAFGKEYRTSNAAKLYDKDSSNKTLIIEDVQDSGLALKANSSYEIVISAGSVKTGSVQTITNKAELKDTISGVNSVAPAIDKVTLESANRMVIKFNRSINTNGLSASDVKVKGFIKKIDDSVQEATLTGSKQIKLSSSGDTLTISTASDSVKLATSDVSNLIEIAKETIKDNDGIVNEDAYTRSDVKDVVDNAAPEMIGAYVNSSDRLQVTYTESVKFKSNDNKAANQFSVTEVEKDREGKSQSVSGNVITLDFDSNTFDTSKDYSDARLKYSSNTNYSVRDLEGNVAANATVTGFYTGSTSSGDRETAKDKAYRLAKEALLDLEKYTKAGAVTVDNKTEAAKALKAAEDAVAKYELEGGKSTDLNNISYVKTVKDAIAALPTATDELKGSFGNILGADYVEITLPAGKTVTSVKVDGTETAKSNYNVEDGVLTILKVKDTNKIEITTNDNVVYKVVK